MNDLTLEVPVGHSRGETLNIGLTEFIEEFGDELLESLNRSNPPVYAGIDNPARQRVMDGLKRQPFPAQAQVVQA
ncbi:DEAD/DEAH box helicase, partial [Pseudomonas ficuserectae]